MKESQDTFFIIVCLLRRELSQDLIDMISGKLYVWEFQVGVSTCSSCNMRVEGKKSDQKNTHSLKNNHPVNAALWLSLVLLIKF